MRTFLTGFLLVALALGCNTKNENVVVPDEEALDVDLKRALPPAPEASAAQPIDRKLIKNGSISIVVDDVAETRTQILQTVKNLHGYISNESQNNSASHLQYDYTIRVPAAKFDSLQLKLEGLAERVESKNISTEDVTEQFMDLGARLKTKQELETRYREILKQARTVEEILAIETQIGNVRAEIESMEGRLNYLSSQVAYSTMNATTIQELQADYGFFSQLVSAFGRGWSALLAFMTGIAAAWPFVIMISGGLWFFLRRRRKSGNS